MKNLDIEIYESIRKNKRFDELYLGYMDFTWNFSKVRYKADCVEAIKLTVFDKAICGLLDIDTKLTKSQIGSILGLNVVNNHELGIYNDTAETEVLTVALDQLEHEFEMIYNFADGYMLMSKGREFLKKGRKEKIHNNVTFDLFFDMTTGENKDAMRVFKDIEGTEYSETILPEHYDLEHLHSFMSSQVPNIYNDITGTNFSSLKVIRSSHRVLTIRIGVLYNQQTSSHRLVAYTPGLKQDYFSKSLNDNSLKQKVLFQFGGNFIRTQNKATALQESFFAKTNRLQQDVEKHKNNKKTVSVIVEEYEKNKIVYDVEEFMLKFENIISDSPKEVYLFFDTLGDFELQKIALLSNYKPETNLFVSYSNSNDDIECNNGNVFFHKTEKNYDDIICLYGSTAYYVFQFVHDFGQGNVLIDKICRKQNISYDVRSLKKEFASSMLVKLIDSAKEELTSRVYKANKKDISFLRSLDAPFLTFKSFIDELNARNKVDEFNEKRELLLDGLYEEYGDLLEQTFNSLQRDVDVEKITKQEDLNELKSRVDNIRDEVSGKQILLKNRINDYYAIINKREQYIKDIIASRTYVIDTNVFLNEPRIINRFSYTDKVILSLKVLDELGKKKIHKDVKIRENAGVAIRDIRKYLDQKNNRVRCERADIRLLPNEYDPRVPDNMILALAIAHKKDYNFYLLTDDVDFQNHAIGENVPVISLKQCLEHYESKNKELDRLKQVQNVVNNTNKKNNRK